MIRIRIVTIGNLPISFNKKKLEKWKSKIFTLDEKIVNFTLPNNSDGENWEFTDSNLIKVIPQNDSNVITLAIVNVPLELNYYARRIDDNFAVITFYQMKEILENKNIPLENIVLRVIYSYCLVYLRNNGRIPKTIETRSFTHDETRGCLFDMTGIKDQIIYSCIDPQICSECLENLKKDRVAVDTLNMAQKEIKRIKRSSFYNLIDFIKMHLIISIIISSLTAIILGAIGSIVASIIFEKYLKSIFFGS